MKEAAGLFAARFVTPPNWSRDSSQKIICKYKYIVLSYIFLGRASLGLNTTRKYLPKGEISTVTEFHCRINNNNMRHGQSVAQYPPKLHS